MDGSNDKSLFRKIVGPLVGAITGCGLLGVAIIVCFFIILFSFFHKEPEKNEVSDADCVDVKSADSICSSINVSGYGTMSVDEYVAGVVQHEFGGAPMETLKAQAVAARSYGLAGASKEGNGSCTIGDTSQKFQTYSSNPSQNAIDAANETSGMILVNENGEVARSEYSSNSLPAPYNSYGSMITMSERNLEIPRDWWEDHKTCDSGTLNTQHGSERDAYGRVVYGCGHGRGMGQIAASYLDSVKGYSYDKILDFFYGNDSEYNWSLASTSGGGSTCPNESNSDLPTLDHYTLNHQGLKVFDHKITDSEKESLDNYLKQEMEKAGHGTGTAVAAIGQALVYWFEQNGGYYLQYRWAGGHNSFECDLGGAFTFANPNWGSTSCGSDAHDSSRVYYGMDCSGFVSWATRTACKSDFGAPSSDGWMHLGPAISLSQAAPGDVIADANHIQLVVKNNGDGSVIVAEEGGASGSVGSGLVFNNVASTSRPVISMKDWYANNCTDIREGTGDSSSDSGNYKSSGKGKILLIAGHSFSPYCNKATNECREDASAYGHSEPEETRKLVKLLRKKLISQGFKSSEIDVVNELLGENFNDRSTTKSLYVELMNNTSAYNSIDYGKYKYAIEIHFNASTTHSASGVCTVCTNGDCGISSSINSKIRKAVSGALGKSDNGVCNISTHTFDLFKSKGVPFTYLETEFYDNSSAMSNYDSKKASVANAIAKVIKNNYS